MPIEVLFCQLFTGKQFAKNVGEEIPDSVICRSGYNNLFATGLFKQPCYEWRMFKPDSIKTLDKFQAQFTLAANDRINVTYTTSDVGFYSAGNTTTTTSEISALTAAIMKQTLANSENFTNMMNLLQANSLQSSSPANTVTTKGRHYCWTHGRSYNRLHTSASCENPAEGHQKGATWGNTLGGTDRDHTSKGN